MKNTNSILANMKKNHTGIIWSLSLLLILFSSCKDDNIEEKNLYGLWKQVQITEDGTPITLTEKEKNLQLLIEQNGVYRSFTTDGINTPVEKYGTWIITDDKWLDLTLDTWQIQTKPDAEGKPGTWSMNHTINRFTVLSLTGDKLEIRMKTYVAEKKYAAMFVENERPEILPENVEDIEREFKQLKTYIFTFSKQ